MNIICKATEQVLMTWQQTARHTTMFRKESDNWVRWSNKVSRTRNYSIGFKTLGLFSAAFLIFNKGYWDRVLAMTFGLQKTIRIIELTSSFCRIYATPSNILRSSGSVGVALIMWLLGALIAACGTAVYVELGTVSCTINCSTVRYTFLSWL